MKANPQTVQDFLRDLRRRMPGTGPQTPLPTEPARELREVAAGEDVVARFRVSAEAAGCSVYRSTDQDWVAVVRRIVGEHTAHTVLIEPQPGTALSVQRAAALGAALEADGIATTDERTDEVLFSVDAAITGVLGAVAETGTLLCASSAASARGATLIPPIHISLVAEAQIVGDLFDLFAQLGACPGPPCPVALDPRVALDLRVQRRTPDMEVRRYIDLPAAVSLITGPSKTADIEGVLVTGVHGPGEVHIVIV